MQTPSRKRESVNMFNDMLVDICDALWRNKAFSNQTQGSLRNMGSELAPSFQTCSISYPTSRFSIFQGQAFLPYAWKFLVLVRRPRQYFLWIMYMPMENDFWYDVLYQKLIVMSFASCNRPVFVGGGKVYKFSDFRLSLKGKKFIQIN